MPKMSEVAAELRKLADAMDQYPDAEIARPLISIGSNERDLFKNAAKVMPHPFTKEMSDWCGTPSIQLNHESDSIRVWALADRKGVCRIIKPAIPAEYECDPLLEDIEAVSNA